jgi:hypothetical protein
VGGRFEGNIGLALAVLGWAALAQEAYAEAQDMLQESAAVIREIVQCGKASAVMEF